MMRWCIIAILGLGLFIIPCCSDGGPARLLASPGIIQRFAFSQDGAHLFVFYGHHIENLSYPTVDTLEVYEVGSWQKVLTYTNDAKSVDFGYSCADADIVIHGEGSDPCCGPGQLTWRRISTGETVSELPIDRWPGENGQDNRFHCDEEDNVAYMDIYRESIAAVDGSNGVVLREYEAPGVGEYAPFYVQKDADRLVRVDKANDVIWIYRLSSGELLHRIEAWSAPRPFQSTAYGFTTRDALLYGLTTTKDGVTGTYFVSVDLSTGELAREYYLGAYGLDRLFVMGTESTTVALAMHEFDALCNQIWTLDLETGDQTMRLDLCSLGQGGAESIPEKNLFLVGDSLHPSGSTEYWYIHDFPGFELLDEGPVPSLYEEVQYSSRQDILVMESYFSDHFGVFDLDRYRMLDDFHACTNIAGNSLAIDPTEHWAAVMCHGNLPSNPKPGSTAKGAGVAVVDLDRYR